MVEEDLEEIKETIKQHLSYFVGTGWKISNINIGENETTFTVIIPNKDKDDDRGIDYNS